MPLREPSFRSSKSRRFGCLRKVTAVQPVSANGRYRIFAWQVKLSAWMLGHQLFVTIVRNPDRRNRIRTGFRTGGKACWFNAASGSILLPLEDHDGRIGMVFAER